MIDEHLKEFTLADLEPGWSEEAIDRRLKTSMRTQGSLMMSLMRASRHPESSRRYLPGDPVNLIDWKAYARTDQITIREHRDEASALIAIHIDLSPTMMWPEKTDELTPISKGELSVRIGLWLAHTHLTMGDSVICLLHQDSETPPLEWTPRSAADVTSMFSSSKKSLTGILPNYFRPQGHTQRRSETVWIISDCLDYQKDMFVENPRSRLILLHVLSSQEVSTDWMENETCYIERTPQKKDYLGKQLKEGSHYMECVEKWRQDWQTRMKRLGGKYFLATDKTSASAFFHFLGERHSL